MLGSPSELAPAYEPLLLRTEAYLATLADPPSPLKVAMIDDDSPSLKDISQALTELLHFNGLSLSENQTNGNYANVGTIPEVSSGNDTPYNDAIARSNRSPGLAHLKKPFVDQRFRSKFKKISAENKAKIPQIRGL
jgi:hypothetical protein